MPKVETVKLADLKFDAQNCNKGTPRGMGALETSLAEDGAGRSILLDSSGCIIAGNKTWEVAGGLGFDEVIVVHTTGKELVAVQRDDVKPDSKQRTMMALRDNRVGELNLDFDPFILHDIGADLDLDSLWTKKELNRMGSGDLKGVEYAEDDPKEHTMTCPECGHEWIE